MGMLVREGSLLPGSLHGIRKYYKDHTFDASKCPLASVVTCMPCANDLPNSYHRASSTRNKTTESMHMDLLLLLQPAPDGSQISSEHIFLFCVQTPLFLTGAA